MLRLPTHQLGCVAQAALASAPTLSLLQAVAFGLDKHLEVCQVLAAQEAEVALAVRLFGYASPLALPPPRLAERACGIKRATGGSSCAQLL